MLTLRTSAHIPTSQLCRSFRLIPASTGALRLRDPGRRSRSLRHIPTSTSAPRARADARRLFPAWTRLWDAELRRLWLDNRWSAHAGRVRSRQSRRPS